MKNHLFLIELFFHDRNKNDGLMSFERDEMGTNARLCAAYECDSYRV